MAESTILDTSGRSSFLAAVIAALAGFAVWTILSLAPGGMRDGVFIIREAWDSEAYFMIGQPALAVVAAIAGWLAPARVWRWPLWMALGHAVGMALVHPPGTSLGLIPLTVAFVGLPLVVVLSLPAFVGGIVRLRGWDRGLIA